MNNEEKFAADMKEIFAGKAIYEFIRLRSGPDGEVRQLIYTWEGKSSGPNPEPVCLEEPVAQALIANAKPADSEKGRLLLNCLAIYLTTRRSRKTTPSRTTPTHFAIREKRASEGIPGRLVVWHTDEQNKTRELVTFVSIAPEILYTIKESIPAALRDVESAFARQSPNRPPSGAPDNGPQNG